MKVTEWCPNCGQEANYNVKKGMVTRCKSCGQPLILCSACEHSDGSGNCNDCQYEKQIKNKII